MKQLYKVLPPFAPDYSGVCSALFELGGMSVIIDASGCTGNYTGYDEPRWYGDSGRVFCSGIRDLDAVLGVEEKLFLKIEEYLVKNKAKFIAFLGSPVPMVIGTDYRSVAGEAERRFGIPAFAFDTSGMYTYDKGAASAFLEIARRFVAPAKAGTVKGVNILGATPLDIGNSENLLKMIELFKKQDYSIVSCWSMQTDLEIIARAASAAINVVVAGSGLETARYFKSEYGTPYVVGMPIGKRGTELFFNRLTAVLFQNSPREDYRSAKLNGPRALIIGDQVAANSLRDCLRLDFDIPQVKVASYFKMDTELMELGDVTLECEDDLEKITESEQYALIIADPLYRKLISIADEAVYVELPHIAVSSKLFKSSLPVYVGEGGVKLINQYLTHK